MFQQLVQARARALAPGVDPLPGAVVQQAASEILTADPMDLILYMERIWNEATGTAGDARKALIRSGALSGLAIPSRPWDHYGYAFALENTRAVQIFARVIREFRSGEALGIPSLATQRWLDATETLLFGAQNLFPGWLSTSALRPDPEAIRRNAYWRMFGMDLAFGTEENQPFAYRKAAAANVNFVPRFEELLNELWQAITNANNTSGQNQTDDDRIYTLAEHLGDMLNARRLNNLLDREELGAVVALGWVELTLSANTPVVVDLKAHAPTPAERLRLIGERVGLAPHTRASAFFSMANEFSMLLRVLEARLVSTVGRAYLLYAPRPLGFGEESRRVITEWSTASGKDLKMRKLPVATTLTPSAVLPALTRR
jgi:hypothetical protein